MPKKVKSTQPLEQKSSKLESLKKELQNKFGDDSVREYTVTDRINTVSTGILALDEALGGGIPMGRMIELLGHSSSGKTTIILSTMVQAQKKYPNKAVVFIDVEHALDLEWAKKLGIKLDRFIHAQPEFAEDALLMMERYAETGEVSIIGIDSVPALLPSVEAAGDIGDSNIGVQARLIAQEMRRVGRILMKTKDTSLMFINQKRAQLQSRGSFQGEPTKATGGMALPFYMTTRLEVVKIETLKEQEVEVGQKVQVYVRKHKVLRGPGAKIHFHIDNRFGVDTAQEILDRWLKSGKVVRSGAWYSIAGTDEKVQGEAAVKDLIRKQGYERE